MNPADLAKPFPPDVVSWRVGATKKDKSAGMALAYIDARDVQDRLNEVCSPFGWQCRHEVSGDKRVTCHIGIRDPETREWIWKSDGAGESDVEGEKGSYSDSFKRAAVRWGIGRYLYDVQSPWVELEAHGNSYSIKASERGKLRACLSGAAQSAPEPRQERPAPSPAPRQEAPPAPSQGSVFATLEQRLRSIEDAGSWICGSVRPKRRNRRETLHLRSGPR
jgi:hypothetical protein